MSKAKQLSEKSTKSEILSEYHRLFNEMQKNKVEDAKLEKKRKEDQELIVETSGLSYDGIARKITDVRLEISKNLDHLEEKLVFEYKKFSDLLRAIDIAKRELEEIHDISANADSYVALLRVQEEQKAQYKLEMQEEKEAFEAEMEERRAQWKKEEVELEEKRKIQAESLQKNRQREEESYRYELEKRRKQELDEYEQNKKTLQRELDEKKKLQEAELAQRENELKKREERVSELEKQVAQFPEEIRQIKNELQAKVAEEIEKKYQFEITLSKKEIDGERKLYQQKIEALSSKIKEQEEQIARLIKKADVSSQQVQDIAIKAVESASLRNVTDVPEKKNNPSKSSLDS